MSLARQEVITTDIPCHVTIDIILIQQLKRWTVTVDLYYLQATCSCSDSWKECVRATHTHAHAHTHALALSLSLSYTHTHMHLHTHCYNHFLHAYPSPAATSHIVIKGAIVLRSPQSLVGLQSSSSGNGTWVVCPVIWIKDHRQCQRRSA